MTTTKTTKTEKTTTNNAFTALITAYESKAQSAKDNNELATELDELAKATTHSVLKKCINVSFNTELVSLKKSIVKDSNNLNNLHRISKDNYKGAYNDKGDYYTDVIDKDSDKAVTKLIKSALGDGIDLVNDCIVAILTETEKAKTRNSGVLADNFMITPYTIRKLKKKVYIQKSDSVNGWETVETTPIQEVYKSVRRCIEAQRSIKTATNGYTYLEDLAKDSESDAESVIYRRFGKYADIGGSVTDYNGKEVAYTTDNATAEKIDNIIESLNLTARQAKVLQLRQSGYGYKAIATYLGIDRKNVMRTCKQIQTKAFAIGLTPTKAKVE